jgi:hypothetical protein
MKKTLGNWRSLLWVLLAVASLGLTACATTESENDSARPWNAPKGWENGLPGVMTEGR